MFGCVQQSYGFKLFDKFFRIKTKFCMMCFIKQSTIWAAYKLIKQSVKDEVDFFRKTYQITFNSILKL